LAQKTVSISGEIETVGLFEGDEEVSGSFEGRGTGALPDVLKTSGLFFGSAVSQKNHYFFWTHDAATFSPAKRRPRKGAFRLLTNPSIFIGGFSGF